MDTMTELTYSSNHFFDGINTRFGINTDEPQQSLDFAKAPIDGIALVMKIK